MAESTTFFICGVTEIGRRVRVSTADPCAGAFFGEAAASPARDVQAETETTAMRPAATSANVRTCAGDIRMLAKKAPIRFQQFYLVARISGEGPGASIVVTFLKPASFNHPRY